MTQLFDTATYDASDNHADVSTNAATASTPLPRLLHVVSSTPDPQLSAQWRLDDSTIEIGRRGIAMARAALRDVNRTSATGATAPAVLHPADDSDTAAETNDRPARKAA